MHAPINARRSAVLTLLIVFAVMTVTGVVMFFWPGRDAHVLALGRQVWENIHMAGGVAFMASGALHMALNWKALKRHVNLAGRPDRTSGALPTA